MFPLRCTASRSSSFRHSPPKRSSARSRRSTKHRGEEPYLAEISFGELNQLTEQYSDLSEAHYFYGGRVQLRFDKKKWIHYLVTELGLFEAQSGVTGTCKIIDKSAPLMAWAVKKTLEKLRKLIVERKLDGNEDVMFHMFIGELDQLFKEAKTAKDDELETAGDVGHVAHDWIENYIRAVLAEKQERVEELLAKFPPDERAKNCCIAALGWMAGHNVRWISTERKVYSRLHKFAGTLDGLALVDSCSDEMCCRHEFKDRLTITDWKTSNALYIEYLLQTAAYWIAYEEERPYFINDLGEVTDRWIIRLGKDDAEFDPWHCERETLETDARAFLNALKLTLSVREVEDRVNGIKGMRRAILREIEKQRKLAEMKIRCPKADDYKGKRLSKCLEDGTQCAACAAIYEEVQRGKTKTKPVQELLQVSRDQETDVRVPAVHGQVQSGDSESGDPESFGSSGTDASESPSEQGRQEDAQEG